MDSIFNQTYRDYEVIILDDRSDDNSREILQHYQLRPEVSHCVFNERNSGSPFRQWKKGVDHANGHYIWIAESDDFCEPTFLERLVPILDADPSVGIAFCDIHLTDAGGNVIPRYFKGGFRKEILLSSFKMEGVKVIRELLAIKNVIPNASAVVFRKNVFNKIPNTYQEFRFVGDWLVWVLMLQYCDLFYLAEKLSYFRSHDRSTRVPLGKVRDLERLRERYLVANTVKSFGLDPKTVKFMYDKLARKLLNLVSLRGFLSSTSFREIRSFSVYDSQLYRRLIRLGFGRMLRRVGVTGS
jgi:glycosyltransferase involved in cell wall biosynthesis